MKFRPQIDLDAYREPLVAILRAIAAQPDLTRKQLEQLLRHHSKGGAFFRNDDLIYAYRELAGQHGLPPFDSSVLQALRMKPVRTSSGVTTVTVLTKPFPCPGECIFCPNDVRMPKSYLSDEPGAQRAELNGFDPYLQTYMRLTAYHKIGHPTDKIEVIVLGGTWSFYPETYQLWFIKRIFDALHDFGNGIDRMPEVRALLESQSQFKPDVQNTDLAAHIDGTSLHHTYNQVVQSIYKDEMYRSREQAHQIAAGLSERTPITEFATWAELEAAHRENEDADCRCVGLVIETRPDHISVDEVLRIRRLGCTKVQIGFQSLNDEVLRKNRRGHAVAATRRAVKLLRQAGFKIHAHWMPNLYGSDVTSDIEDYHLLFNDADFRPDELKIYPCSLLESAELMQRYQDGSWRPYTQDELITVLKECFRTTPEYVRLTRVIRDIPGTDIVVGNKLTNLRQLVEDALAKQGERSRDIRAREIGAKELDVNSLSFDEQWYVSSIGEEVFLQFITPSRQIAGFLRLSLPTEPAITDELQGAAMIREVHVYGQAVNIGETSPGRAQHAGLGTQLIERAAEIAAQRGYANLAVISAIGTRGYYRKRGFEDGSLYQLRSLT
ncbi:MAG: tRNA uridine(34) 5-carboxymethylaminomethyl modification radical SAM/GNAT enzyme Elp3 [Anaerolineae bacterium]|nr:tRNA uridine(34) 5-carboxymethylaminomethyl modification radical SAM/GNAT enzyme Elp3 [Anaerolineae bacterium]